MMNLETNMLIDLNGKKQLIIMNYPKIIKL